MNRAVHPAASGQRFVGRVDDRIGPQPGNVPFNQPQYRLPNPRLPHPRLQTEFQVSSSKFQEEGARLVVLLKLGTRNLEPRPPGTWNSLLSQPPPAGERRQADQEQLVQ